MESIKTKARMFALTVTVLAALMGAGLAGSVGLHGPPPVSAHSMERSTSTFYLECPTEVTEGESFEAYLVREPADGLQNVNFGAWWHTESRYADENDYISLPGESEDIQWTTDAERAANRQARTIVTLDDDDIEGDNFLWVSFTPTEQVANPNHPAGTISAWSSFTTTTPACRASKWCPARRGKALTDWGRPSNSPPPSTTRWT